MPVRRHRHVVERGSAVFRGQGDAGVLIETILDFVGQERIGVDGPAVEVDEL